VIALRAIPSNVKGFALLNNGFEIGGSGLEPANEIV
jgi:hypothetical protein